MPVVLAHDDFAAWLAQDGGAALLQSLLRPCAPESIKMHPVTGAVGNVANDNATSFPTATAAVKTLENLGIVTEMTGQKKNRSYSYQAYVNLLTR